MAAALVLEPLPCASERGLAGLNTASMLAFRPLWPSGCTSVQTAFARGAVLADVAEFWYSCGPVVA